MVPFKLRIIREKNRIFTFLLKFLSGFSKGVEVFIFHDILENRDMVKTPFAISQESFEKFLLKQIEIGKRTINYAELKEIILNKKVIKHGFIITFDDCNSSVFSRAYPFLKKYHIPFILFITVELIGKLNYLTAEQISELSKDTLCTVGSHAVHHKMFRYLTDKEAIQEFNDSKHYLQKLTGQLIDSFAFPYGRLIEVSLKSVHLLSKVDFNFAFSAIPGNLNQKWFTGNYFLPRVNVSEDFVDSLLNKYDG